MHKPRKPQINFQVEKPLKLLYDEAKYSGYYVARLCAAGLLLMVEDARARRRALARLRRWEEEFEAADTEDIQEFISGLEAAMDRANRPRPRRKRA